MKRVRVELVCDEGYVAESLVELIGQYENSLEMDEYYLEHGTAIIEHYKEEEE